MRYEMFAQNHRVFNDTLRDIPCIWTPSGSFFGIFMGPAMRIFRYMRDVQERDPIESVLQ
jgi:hypothetical protein